MAVTGKVVGVNGNMVTVNTQGAVLLNEVAYVQVGKSRLKAEVIKIIGDDSQLQVFEITKGISIGDTVEFSGVMLSATLGPGLLGQIYDGLQNPLPQLAEEAGFFLERGIYLTPLSQEKEWEFSPLAKPGDRLVAGGYLGEVKEGVFDHKIMVPFTFLGTYTVKSVKPAGNYTLTNVIAEIESEEGVTEQITLSFEWPVKRAIKCYEERLMPTEPLITKQRLIDTFLPVAKGGTYCIPGPFGAGKTVLQHTTSRHAEIDIVIIAACGERAGEVVETLVEFPDLIDPKTGKSLMERTIVICNTSSMPVASREASVYTAVTMAEYYRQMGLDVLLLADSTSRWAQAMREMSGRLEEIPGEEAFPAYLESTIAGFYERAGIVRLENGKTGSVTIGGTVSPAGGNFEEPVTQGTLKVVGAFHGLTRERSDARKFPSIHPIDSWSKYASKIDGEAVRYAHEITIRGDEVASMMKVVGEEGTSLDDFIIYQKSEFLDRVYYQQDSFDKVDAAVSPERQAFSFRQILGILGSEISLKDKSEARSWFHNLTQRFLDYNLAEWESKEMEEIQKEIQMMLDEKMGETEPKVLALMEKV